MSTYVRFAPPHLLREYLGKPGFEMEGLALSPMALEALAESTINKTQTLVVQGRWDYDDGRFYLDLAVPTQEVERLTNYRYDADARRLRLNCPDCGMKDGRHKRGCES
jgi:hypothetical protein